MTDTFPNRQFNAAPEAKPLFKERVLWTTLIGGFFFLVYGSTNHISFLTGPHPSLYLDWEKHIPFVPELIVPYMSSDIIFVVAFLMAPTRISIQKLGVRCALAIVISSIVFLIFPLQFDFERPIVSGWTAMWFDVLSLDQPYNQLPSLHISLGYICWRVIHSQVGQFWQFLVTIWFLLIAASTVLVFQHHSIDIVGGILVVYIVHKLVPSHGSGLLKLNFVTPRHLHLALRYMILAVIFTVAAFNIPEASVLTAWIAVSLLFVAASYCLGLSDFLKKTDGKHGLLTWALFWPYLIGSWLNWLYWRKKLNLMDEIVPGVWLGLKPGAADWQILRNNEIAVVLDLAPELSTDCPEGILYSHIPLLDMTIPEPSKLHEIAMHIETLRQHGNVYVHCALGMSRSVLAVSAWLMANNYTKDQALETIDAVRSHRVKRPYMTIALDLLNQFRLCEAFAAQKMRTVK
ncbi:dual specificity protein phosphatase family protein [Sneathiella glossodoripedis]|uniref:dual specificity protein phosphatase family protein n=1 Tax=Sneathiella glossodoripedis TaxID=418853 RepID=UPI0004709D9A|nr:dual specificity protein phosphatase family protein [Sneathiella glossodoripedis]